MEKVTERLTRSRIIHLD